MYPNWHGKAYLGLLRHYGIIALWHQFWYDVRNYRVLSRSREQ